MPLVIGKSPCLVVCVQILFAEDIGKKRVCSIHSGIEKGNASLFCVLAKFDASNQILAPLGLVRRRQLSKEKLRSGCDASKLGDEIQKLGAFLERISSCLNCDDNSSREGDVAWLNDNSEIFPFFREFITDGTG